MLLATWLAQMIAREILLLGRSGTFSSSAPSSLVSNGSTVSALKCDVTSAEDVHAAFSGTMPVSAVFHAGGLLQDGILMKQSAAGVKSVLAPKLKFLSHAAQPSTLEPISQFNIFSSVSGFLGSPGQANYAAANAALDHWAQDAQHIGVVGSSIQWGAWAEVGMAHGNAAVLTRVEKSGLGIVYPAPGLEALARVLRGSPSGRLVQTIASPFDFPLLLKGLEEVPAIFDIVTEQAFTHEQHSSSISSTYQQSQQQQAATAPVIDKTAITEDIQRAVVVLLGTDIGSDQPLMEAGLDSLAAVELRNELGSTFSISMPATVMFDYPTITALAGFVASKIQPPTIAPAVIMQSTDLQAQGAAGKGASVLSISCRYPRGIDHFESFSEATINTRDIPQLVPWSRWDVDRLYSPSVGGSNSIYARFGGFINGVENFDAQLFGLPRAEALAIDPQQRTLLEETHTALLRVQESVGSLQNTDTGVYIGCMYHEYASLLAESGSKLSAAAATGNSASFMVGRLSYTFGLAGPCISTDTACSSSLVAAHLGHRSLLMDDATTAVAGGANLTLSATTTAAICQLQALSPVGRCKTFDASADGYGRGEGFAVLVLGSLGLQEHGIAVLEATAVNQDGRSSSLTAPNGPSQTDLVMYALKSATLDASKLAYVALHGTGTPLGDPIEVNALGQALRNQSRGTVVLGSVKSCYGHTEGAAGVTGLLLAMTAAEHAAAAPFMHLRSVNAYVASALEEWRTDHHLIANVPRQALGSASLVGAMAGTSSFGMSGVNAHAIVSTTLKSSDTAQIATVTKPNLLKSARLWPLPQISALFSKVNTLASTGGTSEIVLVCNMNQASAAFLWQYSVFDKPTLSTAAFLQMSVAAGLASATDSSAFESNLAVVDAALAGSLQLKEQGLNIECRLQTTTGKIELVDDDGMYAGSAVLTSVSSSNRASIKPAVAPWLLKQCGEILQPAGACTATIAPFINAYDSSCSAVEQIQAAASLACLQQAVHGHSSMGIILGCSLYYPGATYSNLGSYTRAIDSTSVIVQGTTNAFLNGIQSKAVQHHYRDQLLSSNNTPAWQLMWQPVEFAPSTTEGIEDTARWMVMSTAPCPLRTLCNAAPFEAPRLHALTVSWPDSANPAFSTATEICVASDVHLEWLMKCSKTDRCLFVEQPATEENLATTNRTHTKHSFKAMLTTYQAALRASKAIKLSLVTFDVQEVPPFPVAATEHSTTGALLQGVAKTLFMEDRSKYGPSIDLTSSIPLGVLCSILNQPGEFAAAVRGSRTYSQRLVRGYEPRQRLSNAIKTAFVAGGTKGLGLEYSRQLVRRGCRFLVVTSRSGALPVEISREFSVQGCNVVAMQADASNTFDMQKVFTQIREEMPYIQHYAHAAGVSGFDMLQDLEESAFWKVADAKVIGAPIAGQMTLNSGLPLESQVFFSSTSAIWSQTGAAHYAAANTFLDALAVARQQAGLPGTSLQLGPFAEAGMAADHVAELSAIGLKGLRPNQLQDAVLVAGNAPNSVYARIDAPKFVQLYTAKGRWSLVDATLQVQPYFTLREPFTTENSMTIPIESVATTRTGAIAGPAANIDAVATVLRKAAKDIMGDTEDAQFDEFPAGAFDSLSAVEFSSTVGTELGVQLPATLVYDYPSVSSMAAHIVTLLAPQEAHKSSSAMIIAPQGFLAASLTNRTEYLEITVASRLANNKEIVVGKSFSADAISTVPYGRWNLEALRNGKPTLRVRFGGFLAGVDQFDTNLFAITGAEADLMDPQQRLLLETSNEALQTATSNSLRAASDTGVYIGIQQMEYGGLAAPHLHAIGPFSATGGSFSVAAGRLSFTYGFKGPAVSMDTACSSAMVAAHTAATYLRTDSTRTCALAGGVNLLLSEATTAAAQAAGMLTADGRCKALDAAADGYVRAESCIVLVISVPQKDQSTTFNSVDALMRATAVNQDGRSSSLTAPNGPAQQSVIRSALAVAELPPEAINTLQMHGTGTALGDPIEVGAAMSVLPGNRGILRLAAAKSRVGHAEPVAGLVGLVHAANMLQTHSVHIISHLVKINPMVETLLVSKQGTKAIPSRQDSAAPVQVNSLATGTSAFAFQGTNAHAIISSKVDEEREADPASGIAWQHKRYWFALPPHALVRTVDTITARQKVAFQIDLTQSSAAYLLDHQISGRALLPGAAMVEACHAVASLCLTTASNSSNLKPQTTASALVGVSIASPLILSPLAKGAQRYADILADVTSGNLVMASYSSVKAKQTHLICQMETISTAIESKTTTDRGFGSLFTLASTNDDFIPTAVANLAAHTATGQPQQYYMHPAVLDCATQTGSALQVGAAAMTRVPVGLAAYLGPSAVQSSHGNSNSYGALASLQGQNLPGDAVMCGYKVVNSATSSTMAAEISRMQFKPLSRAAAAAAAAPAAAEAAPVPGLYVVDWQAEDSVSAVCKPREWNTQPGSVTWQLGPSAGALIPASRDAQHSVVGLTSSLALVKTAVMAASRPEVTLYTPLLEPGLVDASPAFAATAGLLKVAAQEHSGQSFKHSIHDGFSAQGYLAPSDADIFGVVSGAGLLVRPRMLPIPLPPPPTAAASLGNLDQSLLQGCWLVTGGVGDLGRLVGFWASQSLGVKDIVLLGRSGRSHDSLSLNKAHSAGNTSITVASCDIAASGDLDEGALQRTAAGTSRAPVSFIFHAGAVLNDGLLLRQNAASLTSVYVPKVVGAAHLSAATQHHPVARTVYCSSLSAQLGTPGQSNYAAANAALDEQAQHAANNGLSVGSVLWGPWASGMALKDPALLQRFQKAGLGAFTVDTGLNLLGSVLRLMEVASPAAAVVGASIVWAKLLQGRAQTPGIFAEFGLNMSKKQEKTGRKSIILSVDARSPPRMETLPMPVQQMPKIENVGEIVKQVVQSLLGQEVSPDQPLMEAGLDSLGAVELRNMLQTKLDSELPATLTFDHPSISALTAFLSSRTTFPQAPVAQPSASFSLSSIQSEISTIVFELLSTDIASEQPLMEAGLDSLGAVELRDRVAATFSAQVPATLTFDYPTISAMSQYLVQTLQNTVSTALIPQSQHPGYFANTFDASTLSTGSEIVSISCRYPGAAASGGDSGDQFWSSFYSSAELQAVVPFDRWDMERAYSPDMGSDNMRFYARFAAFCSGVHLFDAAAFRLTIQEGAAMDPQIRMLMQEAAQAWAAAGPALPADGSKASGGSVGQPVGVFVGCMYHEHLDVVTSASTKLSPQAIVGNGAPYMVGRLSYTFGLSGPCVSTDTACSSSLVSTHLAHSALHNYECEAAMAAGTNIMLLADTTAAICQLQALSLVGRCKTFEASADGYGRGEGFVVVILQRQGTGSSPSHAAAILAASAVNQGGRSSGLTAPNGPAQTALVRAALASAHPSTLDPSRLSVVSIHGTGTPLGDPIEIGALTQALPYGNAPIAVVSNKACFGHTEGAAGLTGLLAAINPLRHAALPAIMHLREINPYVSTALADWGRQRGGAQAAPVAARQQAPAPMIAGSGDALTGTSSFGMSGVNAHAIFSSAETSTATAETPVPFSAAVWRLQRAYSLAPAYAMLSLAKPAVHGSTPIVQMICDLSYASLSFLCDHQISCTSCMPPAALLELMAAAHAALLGDSAAVGGNTIINNAVISAAISLVETEKALPRLACSVDLVTGKVQIVDDKQVVAAAALGKNAVVAEADGEASGKLLKQRLLTSAATLPSQASGFAALALPQFTTKESFLVHPSVLQSIFLPQGIEGAVISSLESALWPSSACDVQAVIAPADCTFAALFADKNFRSFSFNEMKFTTAREMGLKPAAAAISAAELLYSIDWQAAATAPPPLPFPEKTLLRRNAQHYNGDESLAGAEVARLLAHHRDVLPSNELTMLSSSATGIPLHTPTRLRNHVAAAFVSGVLKNLPYELPAVKLQAIDQDASQPLSSGASSFALISGHPSDPAWKSSSPDMYGSVSTVGVLLKPLLAYQSTAGTAPAVPLSATDGATIITGGLGGLGSMTATWAVNSGAKSLVLLGRSGYLGSGAWTGSASLLQSRGVVVMAKADASFAEDAAAAVTCAFGTLQPLRGMIHAAGVQIEARLLKQTPWSMRQAAAPKLAAFRKCLEAAPGAGLDANVLFSSVSSVTGNANHANYAGANAALDALAEQHASQGALVTAVQWGAWASVGMVHRNYKISSQQASALGMLSSEAGLAAMAQVLQGVKCTVIGAAPQSYWINLLQNAPGVPDIFSSFELPKPEVSVGGLSASASAGHQATQSAVTKESLEATVRLMASSILGTSDLDATQPLALQGLDSLAGLELRQKLQEALGVDLALFAEDPQGATIASIVEEALPKLVNSSSTALLVAGRSTQQAAALSSIGAATAVASNVPPPPLWISPSPVSVKMRLFCLPWAGGVSENLFARWSMMLPASIQVCPIEIPGRGRREGETALTTVDELAKLLAHSLPLQDKPYALFGTCLGAIVSYEIIREVEKTGCAPLPVVFMPAAVSPPHVYASVVMKIYLQRRLRRGEEPPLDEVMKILRDWKEMPREKLLLAFEAGHFAGVEEMKKSERLFNRVAPMGVNDIMMAVQYRYDSSLKPLNIPIIAFDGTKDNTIPSGYMKGWKKHTTARYRHVKIHGTHYFVSTHYKEVTAEVGAELMDLMDKARGGILGAGHSWVGGTAEELAEASNNAAKEAQEANERKARRLQQLQRVALVARQGGQFISVMAVIMLLCWWILKYWHLFSRFG